MIDTHAHLDFENFDQDREEVIRRAFDNGVKKIINIGVDLKASRKSIEIAEKHGGVFASVGMHPEYFSKGDWEDGEDWGNIFEELKRLADNERVVAIGECGLDYFRAEQRNLTPALSLSRRGSASEIFENQKKGFLAQIELAKELNLPVIAHCRNAWEDLYEIISFSSKVRPFPSSSGALGIPQGRTLTKFVLHCYSGSVEDTEKFLKLPNVYFSFSGNITYPRPIERAEKLAEAVKMVPLDRIMLDSDSPFLAPQEMRGKRNEPAYIRYVADKIAEIKKISVAEVEKMTDENAENFFLIG